MAGSRASARTASLRLARRRRVQLLADEQSGVVSRRQVYAAGLTRAEVKANVRAGRWQTFTSQSVVTYTGPLTVEARHWAAVFEAGPRAFLDEVSALQAAGLVRFDQSTIRVSVPRGARVRRARGVDIRQTRRWNADDLAEVAGPPRSRCETAAVRGALWARSDKQAALILSMAVQQRLVTVERLGAELLRVKRDKRRMFLNLVMLDLLGGARSLGEIDFARECRRRDLPEPGRQVLRKGPDGRSYLDVLWEAWGLAVEVDGAQHHWAENLVAEALRHNDVTLTGCRVLRLPLIGLRVAPDDFFGQIKSALRASGWARPA